MSLTIKTGLCLYHIFFLTTLIPQAYIRRRACAMVQLLTAHGPASAALTSQLLTLLTDADPGVAVAAVMALTHVVKVN